MRKIVALLLVIAAANHSIFAQTTKDPNSWDLRRCIEYAMANNISVRQADVQARISEIILKQSKLQQIPSLNYAFQHGVNFGRSLDRTTNTYNDLSGTFQQMNVTSQATIFNWNSQKNTIKSNDYNYKADQAAVEKQK
jgi:outer membrane protein